MGVVHGLQLLGSHGGLNLPNTLNFVKLKNPNQKRLFEIEGEENE